MDHMHDHTSTSTDGVVQMMFEVEVWAASSHAARARGAGGVGGVGVNAPLYYT